MANIGITPLTLRLGTTRQSVANLAVLLILTRKNKTEDKEQKLGRNKCSLSDSSVVRFHKLFLLIQEAGASIPGMKTVYPG
jgi:hypothetical protein